MSFLFKKDNCFIKYTAFADNTVTILCARIIYFLVQDFTWVYKVSGI